MRKLGRGLQGQGAAPPSTRSPYPLMHPAAPAQCSSCSSCCSLAHSRYHPAAPGRPRSCAAGPSQTGAPACPGAVQRSGAEGRCRGGAGADVEVPPGIACGGERERESPTGCRPPGRQQHEWVGGDACRGMHAERTSAPPPTHPPLGAACSTGARTAAGALRGAAVACSSSSSTGRGGCISWWQQERGAWWVLGWCGSLVVCRRPSKPERPSSCTQQQAPAPPAHMLQPQAEQPQVRHGSRARPAGRGAACRRGLAGAVHWQAAGLGHAGARLQWQAVSAAAAAAARGGKVRT